MPSSLTWCLWLKGTGWSTGAPTPVTYGDRTYTSAATKAATNPSAAPRSVKRARLFAPGPNTCANGPHAMSRGVRQDDVRHRRARSGRQGEVIGQAGGIDDDQAAAHLANVAALDQAAQGAADGLAS